MLKKRGPSRPRKELEPMLVAVKEETDDEASPRSRGKRKYGSYMNWFSRDLWPPILEVVTKYYNLS
jgi:hypothetical protein